MYIETKEAKKEKIDLSNEDEYEDEHEDEDEDEDEDEEIQ
jgi:hypothetical protein